MCALAAAAPGGTAPILTYHVTALQMPIYFNREGDHDHNGLIFALTANVPILKFIRALSIAGTAGASGPEDDPETWRAAAEARALQVEVTLPATPQQARLPHPLVRPLVLRVRKDDRLVVELKNEIRNRHVGVHVVGDGYDVKTDDGSQVGANPTSLTAPGGNQPYTFMCRHEGVFPFHDGGNYSGGEDGTNAHGLFGALVVEPAGSIWRDPVTGRRSEGAGARSRNSTGFTWTSCPRGTPRPIPTPPPRRTWSPTIGTLPWRIPTSRAGPIASSSSSSTTSRNFCRPMACSR